LFVQADSRLNVGHLSQSLGLQLSVSKSFQCRDVINPKEPMMKTLFAAVVLTLTLAGVASAKDKCSVPLADWQPRDILKTKLETEGWKMVEAYFDPKDLHPVDMRIEH
jgi:Peptidase propeptide and YPEB domain